LLWGWSNLLMLSTAEKERRAERRSTEEEFRKLAELMRSPERRPFLAPWWHSPKLAYWSGQPGVAGTSHQSLAGTVDSARVFLAEKPGEAAAILRERGVRWVVIDDAQIEGTNPRQYGMVNNAAKILGRSLPWEPLGWKLADNPIHAPPYLRYISPEERGLVWDVLNKKAKPQEGKPIRFWLPQVLKLYEVLPDKL
jgi:hypothetical protein